MGVAVRDTVAVHVGISFRVVVGLEDGHALLLGVGVKECVVVTEGVLEPVVSEDEVVESVGEAQGVGVDKRLLAVGVGV